MLSSQKVFYLVLISIMMLCSIFGISVQGTNSYFPADTVGDIVQSPEDTGIIAQLSDMDDEDVGQDSTSAGLDISINGPTSTTEEGYTHNDNVSIIETTTTTVPTENTPSQDNGQSGSTAPDVTDNTTPGNSQNAGQTSSTTGRTSDPSSTRTTTTTTTQITTTTTRPTTTTTTRTTTRPTTTTTTKNYTNSGNISFSLSSGGSTVTEYRMYVGSSVRLYLKSGFADTPIAVYNSDYSYIADTTSNDVGSVVVTAYSVGTTWIHASNINGTCHIKIVVDDFESRVVYLCNQHRAASGIAPLEVGGSDLKRVADLRLSEIYSKFAHERPNGTRYLTAYNYYSIPYLYVGENLARGQTTPEQVVNDWMNSPTHRANIMNPNFRYCSISVGTSKYQGLMYTYWSQQFYTPQ